MSKLNSDIINEKAYRCRFVRCVCPDRQCAGRNTEAEDAYKGRLPERIHQR